MRFTDDDDRILEVHVTNWCDVDVTERVLGEVGEPGLFGRHVPDVRVAEKIHAPRFSAGGWPGTHRTSVEGGGPR